MKRNLSQHSGHAEGESFSVTGFDPFQRIVWLEVRFAIVGPVEDKITVFSPMPCPYVGASFRCLHDSGLNDTSLSPSHIPWATAALLGVLYRSPSKKAKGRPEKSILFSLKLRS